MNTQEKQDLTARIAAAEVILAPYFSALSKDDYKSNALVYELTHAVRFAFTGFANAGGFQYLWSESLREAKTEVNYEQDTASNTVATLEKIAELARGLEVAA